MAITVVELHPPLVYPALPPPNSSICFSVTSWPNISISAVFASHLAGEVYTQIIDERATFSSQMVVSGTATSTGKSLLQTVCMNMFYGKAQPTTTTLTEATFYQQLENENIYVREFTTRKVSSKSNTIDAKVKKVFKKIIQKISRNFCCGMELY